MEFLTRDGVRIRYVDVGPRAGGPRPLLFVHGWSCDHTHFAPQARHFADRHRVVSIDQRGFGASDAPDQEYSIEGFAGDLAFVCEALEIERPILVGHSLGGAVALAAAARYPELASALVLCDPALFYPAEALPFFEELTAKLGGDDYREVAQQFVENVLFIESDDPALKQEITALMLRTPQHVMQSAIGHLPRFDPEAAARRVTVPVLCILAANPFIEQARFQTACPHAEFASTPGIGHFHQLLAPDTINGLIDSFVESVGP